MLRESRLVTLSGVAGVGKTRLAVATARELTRQFPDGVRLVELDGLAEADLMALTVVQALGVPIPHGVNAAELLDLIGSARLLIVLDNCEHLVREVGDLVASILRNCPRVRLLATSREPLGIAGEAVFVVPPLEITGVPARNGVKGDATTLFAQRAGATVPGFALTEHNTAAISAICRRLDGLPLAIELAAVLLRTFSLDELMARQDQHFDLLARGNRAAPPRHQTLRGAIAWSFDLCTDVERLLWARLSVFRGSFQLRLVESVCEGDGLTRSNVASAFAGLVDKSVVSRDGDSADDGPGRFRLLETIRDFGREQLRESGELAALESRYRSAYLSLAEQAESAWFGPDQVSWSDLLRAEHTNLRAVLELCGGHEDANGQGLRMAVALSSYWLACGHQREGRHWLERFLSSVNSPGPLRARALCTSAHLAALAGDGRSALARVAQVDADRDADVTARAHAAYVSGVAVIGVDPDRAAVELLRGVELERAAPGSGPHLALALVNLGLARCIGGQVESAIEPLEESQEICEAHGDRWVLAWTLMVRGIAEWLRGEPAAATKLVRRALENKKDLGDLLGVALAIEFLAWSAEATGDAERAARLFGVSRTMFQPLGAYLVAIGLFLHWHDSAERRAKFALGSARYERAEQSGRSLGLDEAVAYALGDDEDSTGTPATRAPVEHDVLSRRELQVAGLLTEGLSNREIAARLTIAPRTADSHVEHILAKLGFTSRAQVAVWLASRQRDGQDRSPAR